MHTVWAMGGGFGSWSFFEVPWDKFHKFLLTHRQTQFTKKKEEEKT